MDLVWSWNYHSYHGWHGGCHSGKMQSPIDIKPNLWKDTVPLVFTNYNSFSPFNITNNGHTLKFYMTSGDSIKIADGDLPGKFIFAQGHFHWGNTSDLGSEHKIAGKAFPLELHLVHFNSKYSKLQEALKHQDGLAVLSIMFQVSSDDNPAITSLLSDVHSVRNARKISQGKGKISLKSLLPYDKASYYRYSGSLTTPTCDEVVTWTVLHSPAFVSEAQLRKLRSLVNYDGETIGNNFRSVHPMNNRTVIAVGIPQPLVQTVEDKHEKSIVLISLALIVLFTQSGFVFLQMGATDYRHTMPIVKRSWLASFLGAIVYWAVGFGLTWGQGSGQFSSSSYFFGIGVKDSLLSKLLFEFTFALTAATAVSGSLSTKFKLRSFLLYNVIFMGLIYPILAHWAWHHSGWLYCHGFKDHAGSAVVHVSGASLAIVGCLIMGKRETILQLEREVTDREESVTALGAFVLFFGYITQNCGKLESEIHLVDVIVNTMIASFASALSTTVFNRVILNNSSNRFYFINGALAGTIAVSAGCDVYSSWASFVVGILTGPAYLGSSRLIQHLKIEDPVDGIALNGAPGLVGCLCVPVLRADGLGLIYTWGSHSAYLLLWNIAGVLCIIAWVACTSSFIFYILWSMRIFDSSSNNHHKYQAPQLLVTEVAPLTGT